MDMVRLESGSSRYPGSRPGPAPAIRFSEVTVRYGDLVALESATATADPGQLVCLVGLNGSGKSTLLKALVGIVPATGMIEIGGERGPGRRRRLAYVPQREAVDWEFPISVLEVVMLGRREAIGRIGWSDRRHRTEALAALHRLGMVELAGRTISDLSGGQQQRVMLARALYSNAGVLLLDEPLNGVDPTTREVVLALLRELCEAGGTVLMATHDVIGSAEIADRVWGINRTIVADLAPDQLLAEDSLRRIYGDSLLILPGGRLALGDQAR